MPVASSEAPHVLESRTRDRVLQAISEQGPTTAAALARDLGLTVPAVRRHLENLAEHGLIIERESAHGIRGRGRPARAYVLSDIGHQALESDYDHLATQALRFLAQESGPDAVRRFAETRVGELEQRYAGELAGAGSSTSARVDVLVAALSRDGFGASGRRDDEPKRAHRHTALPGALPRPARGAGISCVL
jgi:predicted ArsR family transcriptional regulator